jgi:mono/diheme cytochrome c family protein
VTAFYEVVPAGAPAPTGVVDPLRYQTAPTLSDAAMSAEILTLKIRHKAPDADTSRLQAFRLEEPGAVAFGAASEDFRVSAAVAAFAMILTDSPFKGGARLPGSARPSSAPAAGTRPATGATSWRWWTRPRSSRGGRTDRHRRAIRRNPVGASGYGTDVPAPGAPPFVKPNRLAALLLGSALLGGLAFRGGAGVATAGDDAPTGAAAPTFTLDVAPLVASHCASCHGKASPAGGLDLTAFVDEAHALASAKVWRRVADRVARGEMPPKDAAKPPQAALDRLRAWVDRAVPPPPPPRPGDPGRVTLRRLTKAEYHATIRDLLAVDETSSPGFPSDDVGYGFDRIGDVLSLPPLLLEKYLSAAERISEQAIVVEGDGASTPTRRLEAEAIASTAQGGVVGRIWKGLFTSGDVHGEVRLPREGEYRLRVRTFAQQAGDEPAKVVLLADGGPAFEADVTGTEKDPQVVETLVRLRGGTRVVGAAFPNDFYDPKAKDAKRRDRNLFVDWIEVEGPLDPPPPPPESHRRLFAPDPGGTPRAARVEKILGPRLARVAPSCRARRAAPPRVARHRGRRDGAGSGRARSPSRRSSSRHFLFHVVLLKAPDDPGRVRARPLRPRRRLSYFL